MELETIIIVSVFSCAWLVVFVMAVVLCARVASIRRRVDDMQATGRMRVQKLKMNSDKNHAFHNPGLVPDEELSRRGYSMYVGSDGDVESARPSERQTGGQFVEELTREIDQRQQRQSTAPPFLLQSIEENKKKSRNLYNPTANGRQSDTNPNFIY
ncbi:uncharacterized protein LOC114250641 [Bombyx mandarina]|uniref:Uncharacterized protein n=2 Tax=Bombyx TaxID=7090 RepID=A0A8R2R9G2_BOMMO|nr:uncharacterized protein LOC114250641 [Bombyx mandarina]XP_037875347.1 uncharacterized protein LOC101738683 isoform X2 [Bombyx mori]